jgi:hypothetical protein
MICLVYSVKGARTNKGVSLAFSVSQLFISSHNSSEVQVVPDSKFKSQIHQFKKTFELIMIKTRFTAFGERK